MIRLENVDWFWTLLRDSNSLLVDSNKQGLLLREDHGWVSVVQGDSQVVVLGDGCIAGLDWVLVCDHLLGHSVPVMVWMGQNLV